MCTKRFGVAARSALPADLIEATADQEACAIVSAEVVLGQPPPTWREREGNAEYVRTPERGKQAERAAIREAADDATRSVGGYAEFARGVRWKFFRKEAQMLLKAITAAFVAREIIRSAEIGNAEA